MSLRFLKHRLSLNSISSMLKYMKAMKHLISLGHYFLTIVNDYLIGQLVLCHKFET